jgi:transposase InsO family protein
VKPIRSEHFNARGQIDLVDMQSKPDGEFHYIGNYQDHFSKFNVLFPLKTKTALEVARSLIHEVFSVIGAPVILQSDNGKEFCNSVIKEVMKLWPNCKMVRGRPRHPQSQGSVEKSNDTLKQLLGTWMRTTKR